MREMHELLLGGVRGQHRRPGELRTSPVWIGGNTLNDAAFVPPPPQEMGAALTDLLRGALPEPLLYLSAYFEQHRSEYYDHLPSPASAVTSGHGWSSS